MVFAKVMVNGDREFCTKGTAFDELTFLSRSATVPLPNEVYHLTNIVYQTYTELKEPYLPFLLKNTKELSLFVLLSKGRLTPIIY